MAMTRAGGSVRAGGGIAASARGALAAGVLAAVWGCGATRPETPIEKWPEVSAKYDAEASVVFERVIRKLMVRLQKKLDEGPTGGKAEPTVDFLALSGGGDWGAFGAGFLVGWGGVTDPEMARPEFDIVTGVSTGALIAPFAFVGTDESFGRVDQLYRNPNADWAMLRDWFVWLPGRSSFMEIPGLEKALQEVIDERTLREIAAGSAEGRVLGVGATNLDLGRMQTFDVGDAAERAVAEGKDSSEVRTMLLASASIPAAFPARELGPGLYSDGGVTANILIRAEYADPRAFIHQWRRAHPNEQPPLIRYWVVINNQIEAPPATVQPNWTSVAISALSASIRSSTWFQTRLVAAQMDYLNAMGWGRWELRVVSIPSYWRPKNSKQFDKGTMNDLADVGHMMGSDPGSWTLLTMPLPDKKTRGAEARAR